MTTLFSVLIDNKLNLTFQIELHLSFSVIYFYNTSNNKPIITMIYL